MMLRASRLAAHFRGSARVGGATAVATGVALAADTATAQCRGDAMQEMQTPTEARLSTALSTLTTGASIVAAAAPALCAVHCAAMPFAAVLLPSVQAASGGKLFGGMCMHKFGRRLAYYFVIPCGLLSNAVGYPQHQSLAVTGTSLSGVAAMTVAATWGKAVAPYRVYLNLAGCAMMLGSSYVGNQMAREAGRGCSTGCCPDTPTATPPAVSATTCCEAGACSAKVSCCEGGACK